MSDPVRDAIALVGLVLALLQTGLAVAQLREKRPPAAASSSSAPGWLAEEMAISERRRAVRQGVWGFVWMAVTGALFASAPYIAQFIQGWGRIVLLLTVALVILQAWLFTLLPVEFALPGDVSAARGLRSRPTVAWLLVTSLLLAVHAAGAAFLTIPRAAYYCVAECVALGFGAFIQLLDASVERSNALSKHGKDKGEKRKERTR